MKQLTRSIENIKSTKKKEDNNRAHKRQGSENQFNSFDINSTIRLSSQLPTTFAHVKKDDIVECLHNPDLE
uniref:Uncharacterized protein n=1 Tax=Rhizophora mucronata TaxID=61149 RepID=A0A2P2PDP5_RHIMU